jgi:hypothetical protein
MKERGSRYSNPPFLNKYNTTDCDYLSMKFNMLTGELADYTAHQRYKVIGPNANIYYHHF